MPISFASRISVPPDTLVSVIDDECVILNLTTERYFGLDAVGTHMWTALTQSESVQVAFESLLAAYNVDAERLRQDLSRLIEQLVERRLVEISGA